MARGIWSGSISFGLINIPVSLHGAETHQDLHFHMLDKRDESPIGFKRYNKTTGKEVSNDKIIKAYEYKKGVYVTLTEEEFKKANVEATQTIDIEAFVDKEDIETIYFETPYYIAPEKKSTKGYKLLLETLKKTKKVAIAKVVLHTKQRLAAIMEYEGNLILEILRFGFEIKDATEIELPNVESKVKVSPREVEMAEKLVEDMSEKWDGEKYRDTYRDDLLKYIEKKAKAGKTSEKVEVEEEESTTTAQAKKKSNVIDLMPLLKQSLEKTKTSKKASDSPASTRKTSRKKRTKKSA